MKYISLLLLSIIIFGCEPKLTDSGKKTLNKIRNDYYCYQASVGQGEISYTKNGGEKFTFININLIACDGKMSIDSVDNYIDHVQTIASQLYFECNNYNDYDGIQVTFYRNKNRLISKPFLFIYDPKAQTLIRREWMIVTQLIHFGIKQVRLQ